VSVNSRSFEFHPLQLGSSSGLQVGETVVAIGNPYGLSNTITVGIVSQTGRSVQTGMSGNFAIADAIQFSAPINPGNSGGPLINSLNNVLCNANNAANSFLCVECDMNLPLFAIPAITLSC
jgi:S1-C subfamily serine protease